MSYDIIEMNLSSNPDFVSVVRLTTSSVASKIGFNYEDIEDMKVCVSEACTNAIKHSEEEKFNINYYIYDDKLIIEVIDKGKGYDVEAVAEPDLENPKTNGLGLFIIKTLMDEVEINSSENKGSIIRMTKILGVNE